MAQGDIAAISIQPRTCDRFKPAVVFSTMPPPRNGTFASPRSVTRISSPNELPSVDRLLAADALAPLVREHGRPLVLEAVRGTLDEARAAVTSGDTIDMAELEATVANRVRTVVAPSLVPMFNLTGTVLHTNLGRAPLPEAAIASMAAVARGASNLEFDLATGRRGDRHRHVEPRL